MRYARVIALLLAMSPASAMAANEVPKISDEQMACAEAVKNEYQTIKAQLVQRATANRRVMSVDDTIAKRRLDEDFCSVGRIAFRATSRMQVPPGMWLGFAARSLAR